MKGENTLNILTYKTMVYYWGNKKTLNKNKTFKFGKASMTWGLWLCPDNQIQKEMSTKLSIGYCCTTDDVEIGAILYEKRVLKRHMIKRCRKVR